MEKKGKTVNTTLTAEEGEHYDIFYSQNVTINDNHGTIIFRQTGKPSDDEPPPGTEGSAAKKK